MPSSHRLIGLLLLLASITVPVVPAPSVARAEEEATHRVYLPIVHGPRLCPTVAPASFQTLSVNPPRTDRPAEAHADLNLGMRGTTPTSAAMGLVDYNGAADSRAPQLPGLFGDRRTPAFAGVARVGNWDWNCNCRSGFISSPAVTFASLATRNGETLHVPSSGYEIGSGYEVLVLHATRTRLTLKYTREDNVVRGYTLHLEGLCVDPSLVSRYQALNRAGRGELPALKAGQVFGRALGGSVGVAIRDNGSFMDPRSRKDWWQGR